MAEGQVRSRRVFPTAIECCSGAVCRIGYEESCSGSARSVYVE